MKNEILSEKNLWIIRILLICMALCTLFGGIALLFYTLREFIIVSAESFILRRQIDHEWWHIKLIREGCPFAIIISILFFYISSAKTFRMIVAFIRRIYYSIKKHIRHNQIKYVFLLIVLCLFLFIYVRFGINTMPVILCWILYKLGFVNWLSNVFGKKEVKNALIISGVSILFFIAVMLMFKLTMVDDYFWGSDQSRVLGDFTQVGANHYRTKVHPFYVLIWQSVYYLFCPILNKGTLGLRAVVCVFAGLNVGIFSLFISRLTKNNILNIIMCAIMTFSFPQISHGSQILEAYIFTQFSIMLVLLYFSVVFPKKEYNLPILLALSLFMCGNNIAYICIFAIFYIVLLLLTSDSLKTALRKILKFSAWFIGIFSVLLFMQWFLYGRSSPRDIIQMIKFIMEEEGAYISHATSWIEYAKDFFNVILFQHLPLSIGPVLQYGGVWAVLLLIPILCFKKITHKPLFLATIACGVFLFILHSFYGVRELELYSPVIMCVCVSILAFITQVLPHKVTIFLCCMLLAVMIFVNSVGTYSVHCINRYLFGSIDSAYYVEYETDVNKLKERISVYNGNYLFFFKILKNESSSCPDSKAEIHP